MCELFVHNGDIRRSQRIVIVEIAATQNFCPQRVEVAGADDIECRNGGISFRLAGFAPQNVVADAITAQRNDRRQGRRLHSRNGAHALQEIVRESYARLFGNTQRSEVDIRHQDTVLAKACVEPGQIVQAARKE